MQNTTFLEYNYNTLECKFVRNFNPDSYWLQSGTFRYINLFQSITDFVDSLDLTLTNRTKKTLMERMGSYYDKGGSGDYYVKIHYYD